MDDVIEATVGALYLMAESSMYNKDVIKDLSMAPLLERLVEDHENIDRVRIYSSQKHIMMRLEGSKREKAQTGCIWPYFGLNVSAFFL